MTDKIIFYMGVYKDYIHAINSLIRLRKYYPTETIIVSSDGTIDEDFGYFCKTNNIIYLQGRRLKTSNFGGAWTERWLNNCLYYKGNIIIKIDPDTRCLRRHIKIPEAQIFGSLHTYHTKRNAWHPQVCQNNFNCRFVYGGAFGITKKTAEDILESGLLVSDIYCNNVNFVYPRFNNIRLKPGEIEEDVKIASQDRIMADVMCRLNIIPTEWDEVFIRDGNDNLNLSTYDSSYAFVHPVY